MAVDTKVRNTMLLLLTSDRNILGIHGSLGAEETYTKEVFWVSRSCDQIFTDFLCFVKSTALFHRNLGRNGIYEVRDRIVSHFSFQGGSKLVKPTCLKVLGGAGIRDLYNGDVVDFFPNGDGRHVCVLRLLDSCCTNFVLEAHSVGE